MFQWRAIISAILLEIVCTMWSGFFRELKSQIITLRQVIRTREFWIYVGVIAVLLLVAVAAFRLATGFDPLVRGQTPE